MLTLIKRLSLNYMKIFIYMYVIALFFKVLLNYTDNTTLSMINAIWILTSTTIMIGLSTYFLYEFIHTKRYYFYHTLKYNIHLVFLVLAGIFIFFNLLYYLVYSTFNINDFIQKLISVISYFSLSILVIYFFRRVNSKKYAANLIIFTLILIITAYPVIFNFILEKQLGSVMIGVNGSEGIRNIYTTIIPLTVFEKQVDYSLLSMYSMVVNIVIVIVSFLFYLACKKIKINWR